MRLVITGGGTGGHVFPALEVARHAREQGAELLYLGSLRGQEGARSEQLGIPFEGFSSEPLYSLRTPRGWKALANLLRAKGMAKQTLRRAEPHAVFSTGGYSSAPVVGAARSLGIPYVIHEQNSVPGRSNRIYSHQAAFIAITFKMAERYFTGCEVVRTGMPIRKELREMAGRLAGGGENAETEPTILVVGGSQGSGFLNDSVPRAASLLQDVRAEWLHVSGKAHFANICSLRDELGLPKNYGVTPYLESEDMASAYSRSTLAVARAGGTLAEFALFGLPSVLVPLPGAPGDHQHHNAEEFVQMGAATLHPQPSSTPERMAADIRAWLADSGRIAKARESVRSFDVPDATERIYKLVSRATQ